MLVLKDSRAARTYQADSGYAFALNEFFMLGSVATRFEGRPGLDAVAMKIVNNAPADALLRSEYRGAWSL